jgi:predicted RND superfamily exporter protein
MWKKLIDISQRLALFSFTHYKQICLTAFILGVIGLPFLLDLEVQSTLADVRGLRGKVFKQFKENLDRFGESTPVVLIQRHGNTMPLFRDEFTQDLVVELRTMDEIQWVQVGPFDLDDRERLAAIIRASIFQDPEKNLPWLAEKFSEEGIKRDILRTRQRLIVNDDPDRQALIAVDIFDIYQMLEPWLKESTGQMTFLQMGEYFDSPDHRARLIFAQAQGYGEDTSYCVYLTEKIDRAVKKILSNREEYRGISVEYAGKYGLTAETYVAVNREIYLISLFSTVLIFSLLVLVFRNLKVTLLCFLPIIYSVYISLLFARFFFNPLKMVSVGVFSVVLGLGIDISFHLSGRYFQYKRENYPTLDAVRLTMVECTPPIVIGILTTACGFLVLIFSGYAPTREFGLLTCIGLILTLCLTLVLFPAVLALLNIEGRKPIQLDAIGIPGMWIFKLSTKYKRAGRIFASIIILFSTLISFRVTFDMDLFKLFPQSLQTLKNAQEVSEHFGTSFMVNTQVSLKTSDLSLGLDYQKELDRQLASQVRDNKITGFYTPRSFLVSPQLLRSYRSELDELAGLIRKHRPHFYNQLDRNGFVISDDNEKYYGLLERVFTIDESDLDPSSNASLSQFLKREGDHYYLQTYVWPADELSHSRDIIEVSDQLDRIPSIPGVEKNLTGTYQVHLGIHKLLKTDFFSMSIRAAILITLLLFLFFRRLKVVFFSLLPLIGAIPLTLAFIALSSVSFSPASIIVIAIMIGIGLDDSAHLVTRRLLTPQKTLPIIMKEIIPILTLTTLSTMMCFLALGISSFKYLSNLGIIVGFGIFSCWLFTMFLVPPFLENKKKKR